MRTTAFRMSDREIEAVASYIAGLHRNISRYAVFLNQFSQEIEIMTGGRGETHLYLLEANRQQQFPQTKLLHRIHGLHQRLVTVSQVYRTPLGCATDDGIRPSTILFWDGLKSAVFAMIKVDICHLGDPGSCVRRTV
jgi:hypothetical protein